MKKKITIDFKANHLKYCNSLDEAINFLREEKIKYLDEGYEDLKIRISAYDDFGCPNTEIVISGDRFETSEEEQERIDNENKYKENRRLNYLKLKEEFEGNK